MSFSSETKDELAKIESDVRHCILAELAAIISFSGQSIYVKAGKCSIKISSENSSAIRKCFTLLKKTFNIEVEVSAIRNTYLKKNKVYTLYIRKDDDARRILEAIKLELITMKDGTVVAVPTTMVVQATCCKRAFIRGAFIACGSISTPEKFYHFELSCDLESKANLLKEILKTFSIESKIIKRKKYFVLYIKDGNQIVDILNVIGAHNALMVLENVRILKDMRNSVNRQVNCEAANINKTVMAAMKQIEDIIYIRDNGDLSKLPKGLEILAQLRLENTEVSLKELGEMLEPPLGKSGVNHRLRKLSDIADKMRNL